MRTVEDAGTESSVPAAATHRTITRNHHDRSNSNLHHVQPPYHHHQTVLTADSNNNHDHHRDLESTEHLGGQPHDHWNKCKSG